MCLKPLLRREDARDRSGMFRAHLKVVWEPPCSWNIHVRVYVEKRAFASSRDDAQLRMCSAHRLHKCPGRLNRWFLVASAWFRFLPVDDQCHLQGTSSRCVLGFPLWGNHHAERDGV